MRKSLRKIAEEHGLTRDGVEFALDQYQKVICEITGNRMSKLSYYARDIIAVANDYLCEGCDRDALSEAWEEMRETIAEMRDSGGTANQEEVCRFLLNLMDEKERDM